MAPAVGLALVGVLLPALTVPSGAAAQSEGYVEPPRVSVAIGMMSARGTEFESGIAGVIQLAVEPGRHRGVLRLAAGGDGRSDRGPGDFQEVALLYGRRGQGIGPGWSVSAGLGLMSFDDCPDLGDRPMARRSCTTVGVPFAIEAGTGSHHIGLSFQVAGNLNTQSSFFGAGLIVPIGWMP